MLVSKESCSPVEIMILAAGYILCEITRVNYCGTFCLVAIAECASREQGSLTREDARGLFIFSFSEGTKVTWLSATSKFFGLMTIGSVDCC